MRPAFAPEPSLAAHPSPSLAGDADLSVPAAGPSSCAGTGTWRLLSSQASGQWWVASQSCCNFAAAWVPLSVSLGGGHLLWFAR